MAPIKKPQYISLHEIIASLEKEADRIFGDEQTLLRWKIQKSINGLKSIVYKERETS